jgi:hypothetical protein
MPAVSTKDLADRVRVLIAHAEPHEPRKWLVETAQGLVDALLELGEWRAGDRDPRRLRSLDVARRVAHARATGCSIGQLSERFNLSRSQIHRLLKRVA